MPRTRNKTPKVAAPAGTRMKLKWVISRQQHAGQAAAGDQGPGLYPPEPGDRARGYAVDSWHGGQGAAPDPDPRRVSRIGVRRQMPHRDGASAGRRQDAAPAAGARKPSRRLTPGGARKQPARHGERSRFDTEDVRLSQTAHRHVWHHARDKNNESDNDSQAGQGE